MHWMIRIDTGSEPGNAGLSSQVRTAPLRSCPAADPPPRRRKPGGRNSPSFDLTPPPPDHPPLPPPQCCQILLSFSGVKPLVPARNPVGFRQNTAMFRENGVIRAHKGPGSGRENAGLPGQVRTALLRSCPAADPGPVGENPKARKALLFTGPILHPITPHFCLPNAAKSWSRERRAVSGVKSGTVTACSHKTWLHFCKTWSFDAAESGNRGNPGP